MLRVSIDTVSCTFAFGARFNAVTSHGQSPAPVTTVFLRDRLCVDFVTRLTLVAGREMAMADLRRDATDAVPYVILGLGALYLDIVN